MDETKRAAVKQEKKMREKGPWRKRETRSKKRGATCTQWDVFTPNRNTFLDGLGTVVKNDSTALCVSGAPA